MKEERQDTKKKRMEGDEVEGGKGGRKGEENSAMKVEKRNEEREEKGK